MTLKELIRLVGTLFNRLDIPYLTFGAVGLSFWIEGRTTKDLDILIYIKKKDISKLAKELNKHGFRFTVMLQRLLAEGRIIHIPVKEGLTRLDMKMCQTKHDFNALRRAQKINIEDFTLSVATPEDIVIYKLIIWRPQDQVDVMRLMKEVKGLDLRYIESWIKKIEKETNLPLTERLQK